MRAAHHRAVGCGASLVVLYDVETGRQLRYTYTPSADPGRGCWSTSDSSSAGTEGDEVRLTYEPPGAHERTILSGAADVTRRAGRAGRDVAGVPGRRAPAARPPVLPPGSELRGLTTIGTVVEDLSAQGKACGLDQAKIKTSIARILADGGFKTEPFGNEDTYVAAQRRDEPAAGRHVRVALRRIARDAGRRDVAVSEGLVAVQVQLLHEGGMAGGSPAAHASAVMDALAKSANSFVSQIRAANK